MIVFTMYNYLKISLAFSAPSIPYDLWLHYPILSLQLNCKKDGRILFFNEDKLLPVHESFGLVSLQNNNFCVNNTV